MKPEPQEKTQDAQPGLLHPVVRRWRIVNDPEEIHQYYQAGGNIIPSVLAACGVSTNPEHVGEFWWSVKAWGANDGSRHGYAKTLDEAKVAVEAWLKQKGDTLAPNGQAH